MGLTDYTISDKKYFESGRNYERERITKLLEELVTKLDDAKPEWYKDVAVKANLRINTIRHIIERINEEQG